MHGHATVLITGGCGAIGAVVVNTWKAAYPQTRFVNLDALTYCGRPEHVEPPYDNYALYHGDICDAERVSAILAAERPTLLVHLAAETHVDQSFGNSLKFTKTNVVGTHTLLECCRQYGGLRRFVHMSTDEVYGAVPDDGAACDERAMFAPSNPYAATKAGAEMLCHAYRMSFQLPIVIARCNNAISPYQHPEKLIPKCVQSIRAGERIPIHGDGRAKRTFIDARDIAAALDLLVAKGAVGGIYNIGTTIERDVLAVVRTVVARMFPERYGHGPDAADAVDVAEWVTFTPDRAFQDLRYGIDASALLALGWTERVTFEAAIDAVLKRRPSADPGTPTSS